MAFQRIVFRTLPDGSIQKVSPFHISLEGLESDLLCRDDEDFDHLEKSIYVSAWRHNCIPVMHIAMSNHGHSCILATDMEQAVNTGELIKKRQSQYLSWRYNEKGILRRSDINVQYLDTDWYVRNALAYIPRNAQDTNCRIEDYRWSSYRGMFMNGKTTSAVKRVAEMSERERDALFRTHIDLSRVPWLVNVNGSVEPASACDWKYLESAFNHDQAFFLKTIGMVNCAEMQQKLVMNGRIRQTDTEMLSIVSNLAEKWFNVSVLALTPEMKARILPFLYRGYRTSIPQLARCLKMTRDSVVRLIPTGKTSVQERQLKEYGTFPPARG